MELRLPEVRAAGAVGPAVATAAYETQGPRDAQGVRSAPETYGAGDGAGQGTYGPGQGLGDEAGYGPGQELGYEAGYGPGSGSWPERGDGPGHDEPALTLAYPPEGHEPERRRGRGVVIAGVVAAAVVGTAVLAAALIGGDDGAEDRAGVDEVTASASQNVAVSEAPTTTPSSSASTSASPSPTRSSASPSPSPTAARTSAAGGAPTGRPTTAAPTRTGGTRPATTAPAAGPTLSLGSSGPEVSELQRRLRELWLYNGPINGSYTRKVEHAVEVYQSYKYIKEDPEGVYGPYTRRALEAETKG